jgi:menaquinone-dependent protoporphyrinogen IX oxidase
MSMKTYIICNSKTGFTRRYADWIAEALGAAVLPYKEYAKTAISAEDCVIFGSRLYAGQIEHLGKMKARFRRHRRFIVFATGAVPAGATDAIARMWAENFTEDETIPRFYMPGGLCYERMGFFDRTLMKMAAKMLGKQNESDPADAAAARRLQSSCDLSDRAHIEPLVAYVRSEPEETRVQSDSR